MSTVRVPAFLTAPADAVSLEPWLVRVGSGWIALEDELRSFDPAASIDLKRTLRLDQRLVRLRCGLSRDDRLGMVPLWSAGLTALKGAGEIHELDASQRELELDLNLRLTCGDLGGALRLRTVLLLIRSSGEVRDLVAHIPGSILWEADPSSRVDLEGAGTRFPTELRSFGDGNGFPPRAAWYLDWDRGDLTLPVLGSVRLYLNASHPLMSSLAEGEPDPELDRIREALDFDIARQLITGALANRDFLADPDGFPTGSVGATVRRLCRGVLFPYSSLDELALRANWEPSRFEADLQASISLYWGTGE